MCKIDHSGTLVYLANIQYRKTETLIKILQIHSQARHVENLEKDSKNHNIRYTLIKSQWRCYYGKPDRRREP
jgi:hypothetical protein